MIRNWLLLTPEVGAVARDQIEIDSAWVRVLRVKLLPHGKGAPAPASRDCGSLPY